jgi:hypothetical protein
MGAVATRLMSLLAPETGVVTSSLGGPIFTASQPTNSTSPNAAGSSLAGSMGLLDHDTTSSASVPRSGLVSEAAVSFSVGLMT